MAQFPADDLGQPQSRVCRVGGASGQDHSLPRRRALPRARWRRGLVLPGVVNATIAAASTLLIAALLGVAQRAFRPRVTV